MSITSLLLRLYPRRWRERYEEEFVALLAESPMTAGVVADILGAAVREHWRAIGAPGQTRGALQLQGLGLAALGTAVACLVGLLAQAAALAIYARYGARPEFHSVITEGLPRLAHPPQILRSLPTLAWLSNLGMARTLIALAAAAFSWRWRLIVSGRELCLWFIAFFVAATSQQLRDILTSGQPGFPVYTRFEIWESAVLNIVAASAWLASVTPLGVKIRQRIKDLRSPTVPPGGTLGLRA